MTRYALLFAAAAALFVARPASADPILGGKLYAEGKDVTVRVEVLAPDAAYKSELWLLTPGFESLIGLSSRKSRIRSRESDETQITTGRRTCRPREVRRENLANEDFEGDTTSFRLGAEELGEQPRARPVGHGC